MEPNDGSRFKTLEERVAQLELFAELQHDTIVALTEAISNISTYLERHDATTNTELPSGGQDHVQAGVPPVDQ